MNLPEFSYPIEVEKITTSPSIYEIEANQEERQLITKRLNIEGVSALKARLSVVRKSSHKICVKGNIEAQVTQSSVRTLEKLDRHITFLINEYFSTLPEEKYPEIELSLGEEVEPLLESTLDVGELVVQCLSLQLQPYLKDDDVDYLDYIEDENSLSPFQKLKDSMEVEKPKK